MGHQLCCIRGCKNDRYDVWYVCLVHATVLVKTGTLNPSLTARAVSPTEKPKVESAADFAKKRWG